MSEIPTWLQDDDEEEDKDAQSKTNPEPENEVARFSPHPPPRKIEAILFDEEEEDVVVEGPKGGSREAVNDKGRIQKKPPPAPAPKHRSGEIVDVGDVFETPRRGRRRDFKPRESPRVERKAKPMPKSTPKKPRARSPVKSFRERRASGDSDGSPLDLSAVASSGPIGVNVGLAELPQVDLSIVDPLSPADAELFKPLVDCVGLSAVERLCSSKFQHRLEAVEQIRSALMEMNPDAPGVINLFHCSYLGLQHLITDPVPQVFACAAELLQMLVTEFPEMDDDLCLRIVSALVSRLKETNSRNREIVITLLAAVADRPGRISESIAAVICGEAKQVPVHWRTLLGKVDVMSRIASSNEAFVSANAPTILHLVRSGLTSTNGKVRQATINLAVNVFRVVGNGLDECLVDVSPATVRTLRDILASQHSNVQVGGEVDRQEAEDIAAFEAEAKTLGDNKAIVDKWSTALSVKSVCCLWSANWKLREQLIVRLHHLISSGEERRSSRGCIDLQQEEAFDAVCGLCEKALNDSVPPVVAAAVLLAKTLRTKIADQAHLASFAGLVVPHLVRHCASNTLHAPAMAVIVFFAESALGPAAIGDIVIGIDYGESTVQKASPKLALPHLDVVQKLIGVFGFRNVFALERVMPFVVLAIQHSNVNVRREGLNIAVEAYRSAGSAVEKYLEGMSASLLKEAKERFAQISAAEAKNSSPGRRKFGGGRRLANIVQPLHSVAPEDEKETGASIRQRILRWNAAKREEAQPLPRPSAPTRNRDEDDDDDDFDDEPEAVSFRRKLLQKSGVASDQHHIRQGAGRNHRIVFNSSSAM